MHRQVPVRAVAGSQSSYSCRSHCSSAYFHPFGCTPVPLGRFSCLSRSLLLFLSSTPHVPLVHSPCPSRPLFMPLSAVFPAPLSAGACGSVQKAADDVDRGATRSMWEGYTVTRRAVVGDSACSIHSARVTGGGRSADRIPALGHLRSSAVIGGHRHRCPG